MTQALIAFTVMLALTFMRMPVMGLPEWKQAIDCFAEDGANVVILWTAGGFRSKKFPVTWGHNEDHANVQKDFARELIDYAHRKNIRVLLGFTPFGYDGVNRLPLEQPELKARKQDGSVVCWGSNLFGQLGDGTTDNHTTPLLVPRLSDVISLAAGRAHVRSQAGWFGQPPSVMCPRWCLA